MRADTKVSRRSFFISNFVCTGLWILLFIIKCVLYWTNSRPITWVDLTVFLCLLTVQVYFAAASRSYWIDYEQHKKKQGYYEARVDQQATLNQQLFGVSATEPENEMMF